MLINKTDRENKKAERTFNINKGDVVTPINFTSLPDKKTIEGTAFLDGLEDDEIIRIKAEDGSEEYIEIIFPKDNKDWKDIAIDVGEYLLDKGIDAVTMIKGGKLGKLGKVANLTNKAKKVLTKQDVLDVIKNKYKLKQYNKTSYTAKNADELQKIWNDITKDSILITDDKLDSYKEKLIIKQLKDRTILLLRKKSNTGGATIEIQSILGKRKEIIKIHNEVKEDGKW